MITAKQFAKLNNISVQRVTDLIRQKRIKARKFSGVWIIPDKAKIKKSSSHINHKKKI